LSAEPVLSGVDNVTVSGPGTVYVAEDGGDMQLVAITADRVFPVLQVVGHEQSEITGPAFDPSGTRLYFSSQRGASGSVYSGVTYEVSGPFF
jgi:secreted PhoX family phosphatase